MFGQGISREGDMLDLAADCNVVNKSGAWYAYNGEKIGQGRENAKQFLKEHPEIRDEIEKKVRAHYEVGKTDGDEDKDAVKADSGKAAGKSASDKKVDAKKSAEKAAAENA